MKSAPLTIAGIVAVLALAGCALLPKAPPPTPTPSPSASDLPIAVPTPVAPAARDAYTPFDEWDAYLACRQLSYPLFFSEDAGDFGVVVYDSFQESFVHERPDGLWYVYTEVENGNGDPSLASYAAANCILGGTLGVPRYELFSATVRLSQAEIDAAKDSPLATSD